MKNIQHFTKILAAACLVIAACDGDGAAATYETMSFEQRVAFMNEVVLPEMKPRFVAFDASFVDMTCATCHGEGASDGSYAMPSARLPRLPATEEAFFEYLEDSEHAKWSMFMMDAVWPQMAALLELPMFDPENNPGGFSCSNCHMAEGA